MRGLLLKDWKSLLLSSRTILLVMVVYGVFSIVSDNYELFAGMMVMLSVLLPITTISYDEKAKWDHYALTMPISRRQLVISKYLLSFIIALVCAVLSFGVMLLDQEATLREQLLLPWCMLGVALLFGGSILYPLIFKLGVEKARYALLIICFTPTIVVFFLNKTGLVDISGISDALLERLFILFPLVSMPLYALSCAFSCRIYAKKEF